MTTKSCLKEAEEYEDEELARQEKWIASQEWEIIANDVVGDDQ